MTAVLAFVTGEACWWTIHPASKQRSEGEKVRVGDDLILVSVSSERYLVGIRFDLFFDHKQTNKMFYSFQQALQIEYKDEVICPRSMGCSSCLQQE